MLVEISLEREKDAPQRIFESLNSTGMALSQADLIRNYILMELKPDEQKKLYREYWEIIENNAQDETKKENKVSDFIRDYLTLENKVIPTEKEVYRQFKSKYPMIPSSSCLEELIQVLSPIKGLAQYYNKLINPKNEEDKDIRLHLSFIH